MREREKKKKKIWKYYMYIKDSSKDLGGFGDLGQF